MMREVFLYHHRDKSAAGVEQPLQRLVIVVVTDYFKIMWISEIKNNFNNPRDLKAKLAKEIVKMYHGENKSVKAEEEFNKVFRNKELPSDMPVFESSKISYPPLDLLFDSKLAVSKNEAKR